MPDAGTLTAEPSSDDIGQDVLPAESEPSSPALTAPRRPPSSDPVPPESTTAPRERKRRERVASSASGPANEPASAAPEASSDSKRKRLLPLLILLLSRPGSGFAVSLGLHVVLLVLLAWFALDRGPGNRNRALVEIDTTLGPPVDTFESVAWQAENRQALRPPGGGPLRLADKAVAGDAGPKADAGEVLKGLMAGAAATAGDTISPGGAGKGSGLGAADGLGGGGGAGEGVAEFFGVRAKGRRFVFAIDRSGSMLDHDAIGQAKRELSTRVNGLAPTMEFQVLFYNTDVSPLNIGGVGFIRATAERREQAVRAITATRAEGGTDHVKALRKAIGMKGDAIFMLTDAESDRGEEINEKQIDEISKLNRARAGNPASIHVIHFDHGFSRKPGSKGLESLARRNNGTYRLVKVGERDS